jgi:hypothetical protein
MKDKVADGGWPLKEGARVQNLEGALRPFSKTSSLDGHNVE